MPLVAHPPEIVARIEARYAQLVTDYHEFGADGFCVDGCQRCRYLGIYQPLPPAVERACYLTELANAGGAR